MSRLQHAFIAMVLLLPTQPVTGEEAQDHTAAAPEPTAQEQAVAPLDPARGLAIIHSLDRLRRSNPSTWQALDTNGDGGLCAEELRPIAGAQASALVAMFDSDNNQRLDPYEIAFYAAEASRSADARAALGDQGTPRPVAGPEVVRPRPVETSGAVMAAQSLPGPYWRPGITVTQATHRTASTYVYGSSTRVHFGYACPVIIHRVPWPGPAPTMIWQRRATVRPHTGLVPGTGSASAGVSTLHVTPRRP